ncbi:hypothetical protein WJX82_011428 [Trebouxia sp. C0006]
MTLPAFQFLPGPRVKYYQQEEQFWHQRDAKLRELACTDCNPLHSSTENQPSLTVKNDRRCEAIPGTLEDHSGDQESPTSVLADYRVSNPAFMDTLAPADVQDRRSIKQQLEVQKRLVELAELQEDVVQQLQSMEAAKMQMAEQKLAEQTRLAADLDVRLQAACCSLDCSAGSLHSLQADINRLSTKLQQGTTSSKGLVTDESWKQLSAQCDRLMRNRVLLCNSQPLPSAWGWMGEEPPGTTVGNLNQRIAALEDALDAEKREKVALAEEVVQKAVQLKELKAHNSISQEASDISEQLKSAQKCFESAMLGSYGAHVTGRGEQKKTHRSRPLAVSVMVLVMLRETLKLSPAPDCLGSCRASQQGQEGDRGAVVLREAYRGMLLQQQARHRAELDKQQAKYQRQLDAQSKAHEEAMGGLIKGGYIKTCTAGDLKLSGPLTGQVKMLLEENAALQGNIHALKDDMTNRVEYALWQQRQAHEASLAETYQQHAQELQAVGPASQQVHEEEVKTLISEAVLAKEAEHAADLTRLQQGFEAQLQECEEDLKDRDRQYSALLRELKALKRRYRSTDASSVSSEEPHDLGRFRLDKLLGPCMDDSPPCQGSPPRRPSHHHQHPLPQSHHRRSAPSSPTRVGSPARVGCHVQHRRTIRGHAPAVVEIAALSSVESPLTSMVNAVLGNRERRALAPVQPSPPKPAQLPELLPGHASPDTTHDVPGAPPPDLAGTRTAADGAYLHQLQQELCQLAIHQAVVDDLSFAYQLQLEEVLQASAGRPGMDVSARMFAPESEECLQRRAAVEAQAKLYDAAIAAQADRALAQKVHNEQTEHVKESCKDHELAKDVELKGEAVLHHPHLQRQNVPAATDLICAACESNIEGTKGYAAALRSPAGMVKEPMEDVAELRAVLGGLQKAHENGVLDLVLCLRPELLQQVMNRQMAQSSRLGGHLADVHEAMLPFTVKGKVIAAADLHMLSQLRAAKTGEAAEGGTDSATQTQTELPETSSSHRLQEELGIDGDECTVLLRSREDINRLTQLEAEAKIPEAAKFYCPQRDCSNLLIVKKTTHAEVECSACRAYLCTICRGFGHSGMSCAEAKASRVDDSDTLSLATQQGWKRCPSCRHVIERQTGCNHMTCRCGTQLCYACGTGYVRGQKQCKCELFEVGNALDADPQGPHSAVEVAAAVLRLRISRFVRWPDPALYKTVICRNWRAGHCTYGARCSFAHGASELRSAALRARKYNAHNYGDTFSGYGSGSDASYD